MSAIIVTGYGEPVVSLLESAEARRDDLLVEAGEVKTIQDRIDADSAYAALSNLKSYLDSIEAQREAAKAPHLALGRNIDALSKELTADLKSEQNRIAICLGEFERIERDRAEDERRKQEAEIARIEREAQATAARAMHRAPSEEAGIRAADSVLERASSQIAEARQQIATTAAPKVEGSMLRGKVEYEVEDMAAMYAAYPTFCKVTDNKTVITSALRANPNLKVPGLRHWKSNKVSV